MTAPPDDRPDRGEMPFLDHLEELRWRILKSLLALAVGFAAGWVVVSSWDVIGFLKGPIDPYLAGGKLLFTRPIEPFVLTLKLAAVVGLLVASPVVLWQLWGFLRPALYKREERLVVPVALVGILLFLGGAALAFYVIMPLALKVLWGFAGQSLAPIITADAYFGFATAIVLSFGAVFELPLVLLILVYLRIISAAFLRRHRRLAIMVNALLSALLTPGDLVIMTLAVMVPVQLLYELSIALATLVERRQARAEREMREAEQVPAPGEA